jgi:hypothetical protein
MRGAKTKRKLELENRLGRLDFKCEGTGEKTFALMIRELDSESESRGNRATSELFDDVMLNGTPKEKDLAIYIIFEGHKKMMRRKIKKGFRILQGGLKNRITER